MSDFNAITLIDKVSGYKPAIAANRARCRTDFAGDMHDRLVEKLDEMIVDLHHEVEMERQLAAEKGTPDGDFWYYIYFLCTSFEHKWIELGPISLLDPIFVWVVAEGEGEVCGAGFDYTTVPAEELDGLTDITDIIARETGVTFVVARVPE